VYSGLIYYLKCGNIINMNGDWQGKTKKQITDSYNFCTISLLILIIIIIVEKVLN